MTVDVVGSPLVIGFLASFALIAAIGTHPGAVNGAKFGVALFGVGAATASAVWFTGLGLGARRLAGLFATASTWRILDGLIAVTMLGLGVSLAVS